MPRPRKAQAKRKARATTNAKRRTKRPVKGSSSIVQYYPAPYYHMPLPPRFRTKVVAAGFGYTTSGALSGDYSWIFDLNSCNSCFNFTNTGLSWNNLTPATYEPAGWSQLCNVNLYQKYRVFGSAIFLDVMPQSVTDSVVCVVKPTNSLAGTTVAVSMAQPHAVTRTFGAGRSSKPIKIYQEVAKLLGTTSKAIENDLSANYDGAYNGAPARELYWGINIETGDDAVLGSPVEFRVKIVYYIEFFGLQGAVLTE